MSQTIKNGDQLLSSSGVSYAVKGFIGAGGQGEVYRVSSQGKDWALKWYHKDQATNEQKAAIDTLISKRQPSETFLWPLELVTLPGREGFGYIMPLREGRFKSIIDLMKGRADPTFSALTLAGFELVDSFKELHAAGLCYKDISFGNVFFEPRTGEIQICDNDNVCIDKQSTIAGVSGTPRFMAPEIVRGEAKPSQNTDLFSLSVLLFYMFMISHPLEGKKETAIHALDAPAMKKLYGDEPLFIFDPNDAGNRPDPMVHTVVEKYWNVYPGYFKDLFVRSFTEGLNNPEHGRVRESEWRTALVRLRNSIVYCPQCGSEVFYDDDPAATQGTQQTCWNCGKGVVAPPHLTIGDQTVMLNHDTQINQHHLDGTSYDLKTVIAKVTQHPTNPDIWGLQNCTSYQWTGIKPDGSRVGVDPGRTIAWSKGLIIDFGQAKGEIGIERTGDAAMRP